jgi:VanZ family protein
MRAFMASLIPEEQYEPFMFRSALALYFAVILLGSIPGARAEIGMVASGLVLHFFTYSLIALLIACGTRGNAARKALKAFVIVALMGALDEFLQSFLPYRRGALLDWYVDMSAGFLTASLYWTTSLKKAAPP